jgi:hypothetical protein
MAMKRADLVRVLALFGGIFLAIQLVPYGWRRTNPPVVAEPAWDSPRTRELFLRTCADCHSNRTVWPWYARIAPISWLVVKDVEEGRSHLNVSEWNRPQKDADEAAEELREGKMPLPMYLRAHPEARLSAAEKAELVRGLEATFGARKKGRIESERERD